MRARRRNVVAIADNGADKPLGSALGRGLRIVEILIEAQMPLSLTAIAASTGLETSTCLRLLRTLEQASYVLKDDATRHYFASPRALAPLSLNHILNVIRREIQPGLLHLRDLVRETVLFVLFVRNERLILEIAQLPGSITPYYDTWPHDELHKVASGKILLMTLSEPERFARLGPGPYAACGPGTVTDPEELQQELLRCEKDGYLIAEDALLRGVTAIGAPVRSHTKQILGCLIATGYGSRLQGAIQQQIGRQLVSAAEMLTLQAPSLQQVTNTLRGIPSTT